MEILSHIKKEFLARSEEINTIVDEIIQILKSSSFMKDIYRKMHTSTQRAFLDIALVLREVMDESQSQQADLKGKLSTLLFVRLNEMLPRALRKYTKALERDSKTEELLMPGTIVELICPIVGEFPCFDMQCLSEVDPKCMSSSLRACLKYGLMDFESMEAFAPIAPDCLRLARELVLGIDPSVASTGKESWDFPLPAEVYEMVVSHSNFHQSMTASNEGMDNARKLEIARLLLSCVSLSKTAIIFEKTIWEILFSAYNAGVSTIDSCLRRLFYLGTKKQGDVSYCINFCFGSLDVSAPRNSWMFCADC